MTVSHPEVIAKMRQFTPVLPDHVCWPWQGGKDFEGYGRFKVDGRTYRAHRVAYEMSGARLGRKLACHTCDMPSCVNPKHIYAGTAKDNMCDVIARGRGATGLRNGHYTMPERTSRGETHHWHARPETRPVGMKNGRAKLTDAQVVEIRRRLSLGCIAANLAFEYGVSENQISHIRHGKAWRHIPMTEPVNV